MICWKFQTPLLFCFPTDFSTLDGINVVEHQLVKGLSCFCRDSVCRMDYSGVIILISTSYVPWLHFAFYCHRFVKLMYIGLVSALAIACISIVVQDKFRQPSYRWLRFGKWEFSDEWISIDRDSWRWREKTRFRKYLLSFQQVKFFCRCGFAGIWLWFE